MKRLLAIFLVVFVSLATLAQRGGVPGYHNAPPRKTATLPPILPKEQLWSARAPYQRRAYELAAADSDLLYQLPCMCHCDQTVGHTSLRSCFESLHGANCYVCMKEVFYADMQQKKGKTPAQIRDGILRSEHNRLQIDEETGAVWMP